MSTRYRLNLLRPKGLHGQCTAVCRNKLDLVSPPVGIDEDQGAGVASNQSARRQIHGERDQIQLLEHPPLSAYAG